MKSKMSGLDRSLDKHGAELNATPRRQWVAPEVKDLPRLSELTLQSGGNEIPGGGGTGGGGSTVVP
jgi:hypothetical protein